MILKAMQKLGKILLLLYANISKTKRLKDKSFDTHNKKQKKIKGMNLTQEVF